MWFFSRSHAFLLTNLPATLQSERYIHIANGVTLPVDRTDANTPRIGTVACQLWYVIGYGAIGVRLTFPVDILDILNETHEIRYDELLTESLGDQDDILCYNTGMKE